jgi:hypothetical protein
MRLQQGQVWKKGTDYYRIVEWARLSISYKLMSELDGGEGTHHTATKKEFCRLIKGAELVPPSAKAESDASQVTSPARRTE